MGLVGRRKTLLLLAALFDGGGENERKRDRERPLIINTETLALVGGGSA
jgi:hypothetical protein